MTTRATLRSALLLALALAIPGHRALASPDAVGRYAAPEGAPYSTEEVRIQALEGHVLGGTLSMPRGAAAARRKGSVPVVVLISGVGAQDRDLSSGDYRPFHQIADTLARRGIGVLRVDDRGAGSSTGSLDSTDTVDRAGDARTVIEYLRRRPEVAKERVGVIGWDEGALIAPMLAATDPDIRAMVLMGSPGRVGRDLLSWQRKTARSNPDAGADAGADATSPFAGTAVWEQQAAAARWNRFFTDYDPLSTAAQVHVPVLILQGSADEVVPREDSARLAEAFRAGGNRDVTRIEWPDANHAFLEASGSGSGLPVGLLGTIADWAVQRLRPAP